MINENENEPLLKKTEKLINKKSTQQKRKANKTKQANQKANLAKVQIALP
jgi:hypothetical protein